MIQQFIFDILQALGNHEFDDGLKELLPFLQNKTFPIVCCNLDLSEVPEMVPLVQNSITVEKSGVKIGIIGYILPATRVRMSSLDLRNTFNVLLALLYPLKGSFS